MKIFLLKLIILCIFNINCLSLLFLMPKNRARRSIPADPVYAVYCQRGIFTLLGAHLHMHFSSLSFGSMIARCCSPFAE